MKKICLLFILQIAVFTLFAQKYDPLTLQIHAPVSPVNDIQEYQGYTIRLIPVMPRSQRMGRYGFDIIKDNKNLVHQSRNPLPFSPKGVQKKEDAFKIAQWIVREYINTGHWQNTMPPHIANELKIESHDNLKLFI